MDWDQYYEKFYDWATSTQISRMSSLTSYGASSEVAEVAQEYMDEKAASRLIKKAVAYGVQFTPEEIYDLSGCCNTEAMNVLLDSSKCRFTKEQLEDLYGAVDDEVLERVAARNKISLFEDDEDEEKDPTAIETIQESLQIAVCEQQLTIHSLHPFDVEVYHLSGYLVLRKSNTTEVTKYLAKGIYLVVILDLDGRKIYKVSAH